MGFWIKDSFRALRRKLGKQKLLTSAEELTLYGYDAAAIRGEPIAVVTVESTDDIRSTVDFARENGLKIVPRGAGTGLSGGSVPTSGGIVVSFERMNAILNLDKETQVAIVQPGVVTATLQETALRNKLFYPPDPSSHSVSTIGGNVAENAGGLRCFKYGVTGHYVLGIEFVDASGEIQRTGAFAEVDAEPDLTPLLVGCEGTLGIFTRIALRLIQAPDSTITISAYFDVRKKAFQAVESIIQSGFVPSVLEYIDQKALSATSRHVGITPPLDAEAMLLLELDGGYGEVTGLLPQIQNLLEGSAIEMEVATDENHRSQLWQLRRGIAPSLIQLSSGKIHEDVAVPRSKLYRLVEEVQDIESYHDLEIPIYGHAGDGNLHVVILYQAENRSETAKAIEASQNILRAAIDLGGTITGEHGIGVTKREYISWQISDEILRMYKSIKKKMDPDHIFNPGKVFE